MRILDIAINNLTRSFRSTFAVGMIFIAPLVITGLIYFAFAGLRGGSSTNMDLPVTKVAVVNLDQPHDGQAFGTMLVDFLSDARLTKVISVTPMPDEASARAAINRQEVGVAMIVPADFSAAVLAPDGRATITLIQDPTLTLAPQMIRDIIGQFMDGFSGAKIALNVASGQGVPLDAKTSAAIAQQYAAWVSTQAQPPAVAVQSPARNATSSAAETDVFAALLAKIMAGMLIFFVFYTGAYTAQSILREEEEGTLARLFTTPTSRPAILSGHLISVFITVILQSIVLMTLSALVFGIHWGQPGTAAFVTFGLVAAASGVGILLLSFVKSLQQAGPVLGGVLTVTGMLGGLFTTGVAMPEAFNTLTLATPQGWALRAWNITLGNGSTSDVLLPVVVLLAAGAVCFVIGTLNFRKRFA